MPDKIPIILDTDIADDIDDAIALAFAIGSPEFDLLGVTTVYGDVDTRARVARRLLRLCGRDDVPVVPGWARPMGYDWQPGTAPEKCSQREAVVDDHEPLDRSRSAPEFIAETVRARPGKVHVLTIGSMTNVGAALCMAPNLAGQIASVRSLAGYARRPAAPEWNVRYDPLAAQSIARSGVPWVAIGADVQGQNGLTQAEFQALVASGRPGAEFLVRLIVLMHRHKGKGNPAVKSIADVSGCHVADLMTLASFSIPQRMGLERGRVSVDAVGAIAFASDPAGSHLWATRIVEGEDYRPVILQRLLAATAAGS